MMKWILTLSLLFFASCGKNEAIRPVGNYPNGSYPPVTQAPPPTYPPQTNYYPPQQGGYPPPYFAPQMPPQMPPQFYPWLPMYQYFQQQPITINVWVNVWNGWQGYAQQRGYDRYDFTRFWFDYCPQNLPQQYLPVYYQMDQSYYYWMDQNTYFDPNCDADFFWANYSYNSCDYCY